MNRSVTAVEAPVCAQAGVVLCRDCCGDGPGRGGAQALRDLGRDCSGTLRVQESDCLDRCDYADVVVVRPSPLGRRNGGGPTWFGFTDDRAAERLRAWVTAGGPGVAEIPDDLVLHQISRPRAAAAG